MSFDSRSERQLTAVPSPLCISAVVGSTIVQVIADTARSGGDVAAAVEQFVRWLKTGA